MPAPSSHLPGSTVPGLWRVRVGSWLILHCMTANQYHELLRPYSSTTMNIQRRKTRRILIGNVPIGDGAPIAVQSMTNTDTRNTRATIRQIRRLGGRGVRNHTPRRARHGCRACPRGDQEKDTNTSCGGYSFRLPAGPGGASTGSGRPATQSRKHRGQPQGPGGHQGCRGTWRSHSHRGERRLADRRNCLRKYGRGYS